MATYTAVDSHFPDEPSSIPHIQVGFMQLVTLMKWESTNIKKRIVFPLEMYYCMRY